MLRVARPTANYLSWWHLMNPVASGDYLRTNKIAEIVSAKPTPATDKNYQLVSRP